MAHGTETCPKVDKILGPGNQYVTAAKMLLQNSEAMVSIDMPAGPSEVLVIADAGANHRHVAAELERQCDALPRRDFTRQALTHSYVIEVDSKEEACRFSNMYAPEHLIVNVEDHEEWLPDLDNAGSIFLG